MSTLYKCKYSNYVKEKRNQCGQRDLINQFYHGNSDKVAAMYFLCAVCAANG